MSTAIIQRNNPKDGVHVQVVVRCRPLNVKERSREVVSCTRNEVCVEDRTQSFKKYTTFDRVFGPESTQEMVFDEAIRPFVENVLEGFNCTIFAYGQTGTGKTYTMSGESQTVTSSGDLPMKAGIIPRTVKRIFHKLQGSDSTVTVNYLELYNEELTDLLDPWSDQVDKDGNRKKKIMRIMEDQVLESGSRLRRGIQLSPYPEDCVVTNEAEILQILERGSAQRQTAETLLNDKSSRSHSIFIINIHMKETKSSGEDVIKIGKLNLVDLAGSENVSRAGSDRKEERQREAGSINQSLLTLGRVINALVDKSPHVPYRDSNLTRLLRDSLGGSTKTLMIATISSGECCQEETFKTLDYAKRAKSIKNRPEVNQRISKTDLVKDLHAEIKRLKEELVSQRRKQGVIVIPLEKHAQNELERKNLLKEMDASNDRVKEVEKENVDVREELSAAENSKLALLEKVKLMEGKVSEQSTKLRDQAYWTETYKRNCHELRSQLQTQSNNLENTLKALRAHKDALHQVSDLLRCNEEVSMEVQTIVKERIDDVRHFLDSSIHDCETMRQTLLLTSDAKKVKREKETENLMAQVQLVHTMHEACREESSKLWSSSSKQIVRQIRNCQQHYQHLKQSTGSLTQSGIQDLSCIISKQEERWNATLQDIRSQDAQRSSAVSKEQENLLDRKRKLDVLRQEAETAERDTIEKIQETTTVVLQETLERCLKEAMPKILEVASQAMLPGRSVVNGCAAALSETESALASIAKTSITIKDTDGTSMRSKCACVTEALEQKLKEVDDQVSTDKFEKEAKKAMQHMQAVSDGLQAGVEESVATLKTALANDQQIQKENQSTVDQALGALTTMVQSVVNGCSDQLSAIQEECIESTNQFDWKSAPVLIEVGNESAIIETTGTVSNDATPTSTKSKASSGERVQAVKETERRLGHRPSSRVVRKAKRGKHNPVSESTEQTTKEGEPFSRDAV